MERGGRVTSFRIFRQAGQGTSAIAARHSRRAAVSGHDRRITARTYEYWVQGVNGDVESELAGPLASHAGGQIPSCCTIRISGQRRFGGPSNSPGSAIPNRISKATGSIDAMRDGPLEKIARTDRGAELLGP